MNLHYWSEPNVLIEILSLSHMAQLWNFYLLLVCILVLSINEDQYDVIQEPEAVELSINPMDLFVGIWPLVLQMSSRKD